MPKDQAEKQPIPFPETSVAPSAPVQSGDKVEPLGVQLSLSDVYDAYEAATAQRDLYQKQYQDSLAREKQAADDARTAQMTANHYEGQRVSYEGILTGFGLPLVRPAHLVKKPTE